MGLFAIFLFLGETLGLRLEAFLLLAKSLPDLLLVGDVVFLAGDVAFLAGDVVFLIEDVVFLVGDVVFLAGDVVFLANDLLTLPLLVSFDACLTFFLGEETSFF